MNMTYAWFEPSKGPNDTPGVRLAYLQDIDQTLSGHLHEAFESMEKARDRGDHEFASREGERRRRLEAEKLYYASVGQRYFTPDLGWWETDQACYDDEEGTHGATLEGAYDFIGSLVLVEDKATAMELVDAERLTGHEDWATL